MVAIDDSTIKIFFLTKYLLFKSHRLIFWPPWECAQEEKFILPVVAQLSQMYGMEKTFVSAQAVTSFGDLIGDDGMCSKFYVRIA